MKKAILLVSVLGILGMLFYNFSNITTRNSLPGGFDEVAYVRNENNLGTVVLYYAFTVSDTANADYMALGQTLPFNKTSGITTAFFFDKTEPAPNELVLEFPHFDTALYKPIAVYTIDKVGNRTVVRN